MKTIRSSLERFTLQRKKKGCAMSIWNVNWASGQGKTKPKIQKNKWEGTTRKKQHRRNKTEETTPKKQHRRKKGETLLTGASPFFAWKAVAGQPFPLQSEIFRQSVFKYAVIFKTNFFEHFTYGIKWDARSAGSWASEPIVMISPPSSW